MAIFQILDWSNAGQQTHIVFSGLLFLDSKVFSGEFLKRFFEERSCSVCQFPEHARHQPSQSIKLFNLLLQKNHHIHGCRDAQDGGGDGDNYDDNGDGDNDDDNGDDDNDDDNGDDDNDDDDANGDLWP